VNERARAYRFATVAQWQRCLAYGFDVGRDGSLEPIARLGSVPRHLSTVGRATRIAADGVGGPLWRLHSNGRVVLVRRTELDEDSNPLEMDTTLAHSTRWVLDRHWLWAFEPSIVRRYERDTLSADLALPQDFTVHDLASDGREGVWLLTEAPDHRWWLLHLDCEGRRTQTLRVPGELTLPAQLGTVAHGRRLVLLGHDRRLFLLDAASGKEVRTVRQWSSGPCWQPDRLITDVANRIAILCHDPANEKRWAIFVLDGEGDTIDVIEGPPPPQAPGLTLNDVAIAGSVLWFAADDGLWQLDASDASVGRESESILLTPALLSPQTAGDHPWLRAEISVDLPRGAVVEAEAVTTADDRVAKQARDFADDLSRTTSQRQHAIWNLFDHDDTRVFHLVTPPGNGHQIVVPLSSFADRWLWLRLKLVTPPGVIPPAITGLRVLYPDASIVQYLPGAFRGEQNDPTGFLRSLVGVLETTTQGIDEKIRSVASQIDPDTAPGPWLDDVARWLALPWENALPLDAKRRIAQNAGALLAQRGTRRGLQRLLNALVGKSGRARAIDLTVDHPPLRIGGDGCESRARLPMLLAGPAGNAPVLGEQMVLGRACLGVPGDPLRSVVPTLRIAIAAVPAVKRELEPLIDRVLAQYVPAGLRVVIAWNVISTVLAATDDEEVEVLDGYGPGRLGEDSELGRVVLGRRGAVAIDGPGLDVGFRLS
jgi:phage tail-like protein